MKERQMIRTGSRQPAASAPFDAVETTRQMDLAWRIWEALARLDATFAWAVDAAVAIGLCLICSGWIVQVGPPHPAFGFVAALTLPLILRRHAPFAVFIFISGVALIQLAISVPLLADVALLVALYTVAAASDWIWVIVSCLILQIGIIAATVRWTPIGSDFESLVFLTGMAFAAFLAGAVVRAIRGQIEWLGERAERLERERDHQATLAAAIERARIAREMHDVVSHNLQVMVTLADAACIAQAHDAVRASEAMTEVASTGRQALTDMRRMLGLWRDETDQLDPAILPGDGVEPPQPRIDELHGLIERVRATGLPVDLTQEGEPFGLSEAAELTVFRIVQEALTNALRHANAPDRVEVVLSFRDPDLALAVTDSGGSETSATHGSSLVKSGGHGVPNMSERAEAFGGTLSAGPMPGGGWRVATILHGCSAPVHS
jgi:signal transduction histidine kinase